MIEIREIKKSAYEDAAKCVVSEGLGTTYAENVRSLEESDSVLLVAEVNDSVVGFACGYNSDNRFNFQ